jgi:hypothetical protein
MAGGDVFSYGDIYLGGTGSAGLDEISGDRHIISGGGSGLIE